MTQILAGRDPAEPLQIGNTTTTGTCELFNAATNTVNIAATNTRTGALNIGIGTGSGTINIGTGNGTGPVNIGSAGGAQTITIDAGSNNAQLLGAKAVLANTVEAETATANANIFNNVTTGTVNIADGITSGTTNIAENASRTGDINIGHASSSGAITIDAGSSALSLSGSDATGDVAIGDGTANKSFTIKSTVGGANIKMSTLGSTSQTLSFEGASDNYIDCGFNKSMHIARLSTTGNITVGNALTFGVTNISSGTARTGPINIGNASSSGIITIDAGTSALNLSGTNHVSGSWTPGVADNSGNAGAVTVTKANYTRVDDMVACYMFINITSKGSMIAGDVFRFTGLPFTSGSNYVTGNLHGPFINGGSVGLHRMFAASGGTVATVRINDAGTSKNADMLVSEMVTGIVFCDFTYWV